jgi:hypothetical protein
LKPVQPEVASIYPPVPENLAWPDFKSFNFLAQNVHMSLGKPGQPVEKTFFFSARFSRFQTSLLLKSVDVGAFGILRALPMVI